MGEVGGKAIPGFDFGNSPVEISKANLLGKKLVQRTTAGTQGIVRAKKADRILASSFVIAEATVRRIIELSPEKVVLVATGTPGDEDLALADYLKERLEGRRPDPAPYLERVRNSPEAADVLLQPWCPETYADDIRMAMEIDRYPFAMEVFSGYLLRSI
jgi:2-phosphosulfolactate phosphatase